MLIATGHRAVGGANVRYSLILDRDLRGAAVHRRGTLYDSSLAPPIPEGELSSGEWIMIIVLRGALDFDGERLTAPNALVHSLRELEGATEGRRRIRSWGEPFEGIELAGRASRLVRAERGHIALSSRVFDRGSAFLDALAQGRRQASREAWTLLVGVLEEEEVLARASQSGLAGLLPRRLAAAIASLVERFELLPTLDELSMLGGISNRQLTRIAGALASTLAVPGRAWRPVTHRLRIKAALLFLSAHDATIGDVASAAGYMSSEAMTRAFQSAGLDAPSVLRERLLAEHRALATSGRAP